jgi:hypothetical protein
MVGVGSPGPADPGHIHEYTVDELIEIAEGAGLTVVEWTTANYFDAGKPRHRIFVALGPLMPRRLRDGMTFCFRAS